MRAVQLTRFGGPEVLEVVDLPEPASREGAVVVDVLAAGINYADTHAVEDSYLARQSLPLIPGGEAVVRTPDGSRALAIMADGGYAERIAVRPGRLIPVPETVSDGQALALGIQGLSAWHLLRTCGRIAEGESVVVHAAAGGVGTIAVQLATLFGAGRVIAGASTAEKRELALSLGAHEAVDPGAADGDPKELATRLIAANGGEGVDLVLEMTGGAVFDGSLRALAPFGRIVVFGQASRMPPKPVEPSALMAHSTSVIGFWLAHCLARPEMMLGPWTELTGMVASGRLRPVVGTTYPMSEIRQAHEDMRARRTVGKLILDPRA